VQRAPGKRTYVTASPERLETLFYGIEAAMGTESSVSI
jgi:hypothetical protein